jgi:hypothetical protein
METISCKRCNRVLTSQESIKLGYGKKCYRIIKLQENMHESNNDLILELVDRVRKLELDNYFMKIQLKHRAIVSNINVEAIERIKQDRHRPERNEMKVQFNVIVKELKVIFNEGFHYTDILKPINAREKPEDPSMIVENLELIH